MVDSPTPRSVRKAWIKLILRVGILLLVVWGIWRTVLKAEADFRQRDFSWQDLDPWWLLAAAGLYALGMVPMWWFWHVTLHRMGQRPPVAHSLAAFFIGHLGKYVPGKAMVVVLRTSLIRGPGVDATVAATSVFVETLTMMAVGATLAAGVLIALAERPSMIGLAVLLMLVAGLPTIPPIFRRLVRWLQVHRFSDQVEQALKGITLPLMAFGWLVVFAGWVLMGMSLWATLRALDTSIPWSTSLADIPLLTACVALAIVAGFLSLLPGGIGVRELVVMSLIGSHPHYSAALAIVSAVVLRLLWLVVELILSGVLYVALRTARQRIAVAAGKAN